MLSYIKLKNFKSLTNIKLDLRGKNKKPKKLVFIYGENGIGKTNLIYSILFLEKTLLTLSNHTHFQKYLQELNDKSVEDLLSEKKDNAFKKHILSQLLSSNTMENLIQENKTIDCKGNMEIKIGFNINGIEGSYELKFNNQAVIFEELRYLVHERVGRLFSITNDNVIISPSMVLTSSYKKELKDNIKKYWGKHTFLGIIYNEIKIKNNNFVENSLSSSFWDFFNWLDNFSIEGNHLNFQKMHTPIKILRELTHGTVKKVNDKELLAMENYLNEVFIQLYADIKRVSYVLTPSDSKDEFKYELYISKLIDNEIKQIPFNLESTGTQQLLKILKYIFVATLGNNTIFIDEIENGIHDLLIHEVISALSDSLNYIDNVQFITTTHNTYLMEELPPENIYVLASDAYGKKDILSIDNFNFRTQKNNNIRLKYLRGDYSGIPSIGYIDFSELVEQVREDLE